jgi:hypothetical protein
MCKNLKIYFINNTKHVLVSNCPSPPNEISCYALDSSCTYKLIICNFHISFFHKMPCVEIRVHDVKHRFNTELLI